MMAKRTFLSKPTLSWWTPYWSHCSKSRRDWQRLFNWKSFIRILIASMISGFVTVFLFWLAVPLLPLGRLRWLVVQIPGAVLGLVVIAWIYRAIPERISIFGDSVLVQHGDSAKQILKSDIIAARIVVYADETIRLRIWFNRKQKRCSTTFGLAQSIDVSELEKALGRVLSVFDARQRYAALHTKRKESCRRST